MQFFKNRRLRKEAKAVLHDARMLLNMNRDLYGAETAGSFAESIANLQQARRGGDAGALADAVAATSEFANARRPKCVSPGMRELVETIVVAFGVAFAFRAYFFQPFKIPTGSMQPTLYGIHSVTASEEVKPGIFDRMPFKPAKWLFTGVWYKEVVAKNDGAVSVRQERDAPGCVVVTVAGRKNKIPQDANDRGDIRVQQQARLGMADNPADYTGAHAGFAKKGDLLWAGFVSAGDQLFVNRMAWNFFPPKRDDVVVFATSRQKLFFSRGAAEAELATGRPMAALKVPNLPVYMLDEPIRGLEPGQHYIKRLVGLPGETVSVAEPRVVVDGVPVAGLFGMDRVAAMAESATGAPGARYDGYHNTGDSAMSGVSKTAPALLRTPADSIELGDEYLPMGDNTLNSYDGRYWGPVPRPNMLGPGAFVYWPLSKRWGAIR